MVLNQLGVTPNLLRAGNGRTDKGPDFSVNGRLSPAVSMKPGEVQMWRIVNSSGRASAFFYGPPQGVSWMQLAQDGVQLDNTNYQKSLNKQLTMAAGNRVDLLVKAPTTPGTYPVVAYNIVDPSDLQNFAPPNNLVNIVVASGPAVTGPQSQFLPAAAKMPAFLKDITPDEVSGTKTITFASKGGPAPPKNPTQHTIDGKKFSDEIGAVVLLNKVEEWKIVNETYGPPISHPFHIHINPFQIIEVFSPTDPLAIDPTTKLPVIDPNTKAPYPKYIFSGKPASVSSGPGRAAGNDSDLHAVPARSERQEHLEAVRQASAAAHGVVGRIPDPDRARDDRTGRQAAQRSRTLQDAQPLRRFHRPLCHPLPHPGA